MAVTRSAIEQARAVLDLAETNLGYTVIKSPVEGVIIDRRVNIGQTVVASLNAPSLFLIAKDLRRMQVWASVNEADIGRIRSRQDMPVRFTVDAYPGEIFRGKVAPDPPERHDDAERGHLHGGGGDRQFRPQAAALPDGEPAVRGRRAQRTCCWCPTRRCDGARGPQVLPPELRDKAALGTAGDKRPDEQGPRGGESQATQPTGGRASQTAGRPRPRLGPATGTSSGRSRCRSASATDR